MFEAKYKGDCERCEEPVNPGDDAVMIDYDKGLIAHAVCPRPKTPTRLAACKTCGLEHPGEC
jgi:hypothetical protein